MRRAWWGLILVTGLFLVACSVPAWVNMVEADAKVAAPIAASLIDVADPSLAPAVTLVENGFNALVKTLDAFKAAPTGTNLQAVQAAFQAVDQNVVQLESAAQIKNTGTQATVTAIVQLLSQAVAEIAAAVPSAQRESKFKIQDATANGNSGFRIPNSAEPSLAPNSATQASNPNSAAQSSTPNLAAQSSTSVVQAKGWTARDLKREFNRIAQDDPRLHKM